MSNGTQLEIGTVAPPEPEAPVQMESEGKALVRLAVEKGVDVAVLERLVALEERVQERNALAAYFGALAAFQAECPEIRKSKTAEIATNAGGRYSYTFAPLEEITRTIRPLLQKHGLGYSWSSESSSVAGMLDVLCTLRHINGHAETSRFPVPTDTKAAMSGAQKQGSALTYGRRQTLVAVLGLVTSDDPDNDGANPSEAIGFEHIQALDALLKETKTDLPRFLKFMGVAQLSEITLRDYDKALRALNEKKARQ